MTISEKCEHVSVVVADDANELRALIVKFLNRSPFINVVGEASETFSAIDMVSKFNPDVLLLDLSMPNGGGIKVLDAIKDRSINTRVVVLSGLPRDYGFESARKSGAYGYIEKGAPLQSIIEAVLKAGYDEK